MDTLPYIVQPVQTEMEKGGAMENVNGKMDNAYTLIVSIVITTIAITFQDSTCHSMATANLNKSEDLVTNTTAASKYIPRRPRISIN